MQNRLTIASIISPSFSSVICRLIAVNNKLYFVSLCIGRTKISANLNLEKNLFLNVTTSNVSKFLFYFFFKSNLPTYYTFSALRTKPNKLEKEHCFGANLYSKIDMYSVQHNIFYTVQMSLQMLKNLVEYNQHTWDVQYWYCVWPEVKKKIKFPFSLLHRARILSQ